LLYFNAFALGVEGKERETAFWEVMVELRGIRPAPKLHNQVAKEKGAPEDLLFYHIANTRFCGFEFWILASIAIIFFVESWRF
jgi:hypothetical protein